MFTLLIIECGLRLRKVRNGYIDEESASDLIVRI